jgi:hypothetical protein
MFLNLEQFQQQLWDWQEKSLNFWGGIFSPVTVPESLKGSLENTLAYQESLVKSALELQSMSMETAVTYQLLLWDSYFDQMRSLLFLDQQPQKSQ